MTYLLTYSYEGKLTSDTKKAVDFKSMADLSVVGSLGLIGLGTPRPSKRLTQ